MGLASWFGLKAPLPVAPQQVFAGNPGAANVVSIEYVSSILGKSPADLWRTQPHLRTVVDFLGRNIAQLALKAYIRAADEDRRSASGSVIGKLMRRPNDSMTGHELIRGLVSDLALWDRAYWLVGSDTAGLPTLRPIPAAWVTGTYGGNLFSPEGFLVSPPDGRQIRIPLAQIIYFHGWSPLSAHQAASPVETLRMILAEQIHAVDFRDQRWRNGGRVGSVLERPTTAPQWGDDQFARFKADWNSRYGADGTHAGGTPILEDGMTLKSVGFSAKEDEFVAASKLALTTVASVYHVNPTMIGVLDNANYSNVREFRRMLYGDTLGPIIAMIEDRVNTFLLPMIGENPDVYVEFNIAEKLQGSFEEQATVFSTAIGGPYMSRNEGRARQNLPRVEGGDELIVPLNVLLGGQASPQDSAPPPKMLQRKAAKARAKATPRNSHAADTTKVLQKFFKRQRKVVLSAIGAKAPAYWDGKRWNTELTDDLYAVSMRMTRDVAADVLADLDLDDEDYDPGQTEKFLLAVAGARAKMINEVTLRELKAAIADADADASDVFDQAEGNRSEQGGRTLATTLASFAATEALQQVAPGKATKTWTVNSFNPRPEHASMDGETVEVGEVFSNGAKYPGDWVLGVNGVAGCECTLGMETS